MKKLLTLLGISLLLVGWIYLLVHVYEKGRNSKALIYAEIPQETIDFLSNLSQNPSDISVYFNPNPNINDWDNDINYGENFFAGLAKIEDECFIIYYNVFSKKKAELILLNAHKAITPLTNLLGTYYYPKDMHGRKLPIYIAENDWHFKNIYDGIRGEKSNNDFIGTLGIYLYTISEMGCLTDGIIINFTSEDIAIESLWHEMNHYVFFSSLDYSLPQDLPMWSYEGIAEYGARSGKDLVFSSEEISEMQQTCFLTAPEFEQSYQNYEGAESIYRYMETAHQIKGVSSFIKSLYTNDINKSLKNNLGKDIANFERDWKDFLPTFEN